MGGRGKYGRGTGDLMVDVDADSLGLSAFVCCGPAIECHHVAATLLLADPLVVALVAALATGLPLPTAARRCAVSLRTAHRRLSATRQAAGVASTAALVARSAPDAPPRTARPIAAARLTEPARPDVVATSALRLIA